MRRGMRYLLPICLAGYAGLLAGCIPMSAFQPRNELRLPDGPAVYDGLDGRTHFGDMSCDQGGRYAGGGSPAGDGAVQQAFDRAIERTQNEIKDIDRGIDLCKGRVREIDSYYAQYGCDKAQYATLDRQCNAMERRLEPIRNEETEIFYRTVHAEGRLQSEPNLPEAERSRLRTQMTKDAGRKLMLELESRPLWNELHRLGNARQQMWQACDKATDAAWDDPCYTVNVSDLHQSRHAAQQQLANYERRQDQFEDCVEDRDRPAQGPSRDTVVPGLMLQQILPGLIRPPTHRPPTGHSKPPSGHSHGSGGERVHP